MQHVRLAVKVSCMYIVEHGWWPTISKDDIRHGQKPSGDVCLGSRIHLAIARTLYCNGNHRDEYGTSSI